MANSIPATIAPIVSHVKTCLERHRATGAVSGVGSTPPLFVAFQGPQGSGKTFLTSQLRRVLSAPPHNLAVAVLSIDDLYLPHAGLAAVAAAHPHNVLLSGRGQPGTHDVPLGSRLLSELKAINDAKASDAGTVRFPAFDKSLFDGQGDRVEGSGELVRAPLDIVLFEGWCVGFCPVSEDEIDRRRVQHIPDIDGTLDLRAVRREDVLAINASLWEYVQWWDFFDAFVQVKPPDEMPYSLIYKWRLQQEHNMKAQNGGKGMADAQVKTFVDRYIPGYVFFAEGIERGYVDASGERRLPRWLGSGLKAAIDEERELVSVDSF
ncbi:P-loop containing nucleoside triphosphate hydrolase protein [Phellopilus nigrolimitatus]|nr:P-loop containing nucleoside triphosphate hydrolase protein [Phellopilus nigrolimitatus]